MFWVYLDHYLTKIGIGTNVRTWLRSFRFRVAAATICLSLLIISVSLFAIFHSSMVNHESSSMDKGSLKEVDDDFEGKTTEPSNSRPRIPKETFNKRDVIQDKDFIILNGKKVPNGGDGERIKDSRVLRANSDVQSTIEEIRSATWVISDELREQYPLHRCVKFIQDKAQGDEQNESKQLLSYCKGKHSSFILF